MEDRFTTLGGLRAHYVEWGDPAAPPVVLLHGLRSYARTWDGVAAALAADHRVLALDHRGRGDSAWDPARDYYTGAYVRDLEEFADRLGLDRFALVGHSMGGANALVYASRHPDRVRRAVIEDMGPGASAGGAGAERIKRELAETPRAFADLDEARAYWRSVRPAASDDAIESRVRHTVTGDGRGALTWKFDLDGIAAARLDAGPSRQVDLWPCVERLACPALVLRGGDSDYLSRDVCLRMAARQPLLEWAEIPGAGHYVHDDDPAAFAAAVTAFLREDR
ncbi:alpha/beta fold hydrolase [Actinomadura sp. 1N219]|uniref:alpha/beta fold hydrolase n=1 Tax=Actinomadura sp. 1N219 TaxID=3375152 RepID=UPI0037BCB21A